MIQDKHLLIDGRILSWRETGCGPPLVLLHGWSLSGAAFSELAGYLRGVRLLLPDLPGHGESSPPILATLPALAKDLTGWLANVAPGPVMLGGWSLGGMVALEMAFQRLIPIKRLLLFATTPRFTTAADWPYGLPAGQVHALRRNLRKAFAPTLGDFFERAFVPGEVEAGRLREIRAFAVRPGGTPDQRAATALLDMLAGQDQRLLIPEIHCPAMVLHGTLDQITPVGAGLALAAALPSGKIHEFAGLGHAPFWTRPAPVAQVITEFCSWGR